jgi:hypothetical protein
MSQRDVLTFFWNGPRTQPDRMRLEAPVAGQRIGYVRVSTLDQNEKRQLEGQVLDRVFIDRASGRDTFQARTDRAVAVRPRRGHRGGAQHGPSRPQPR